MTELESLKVKPIKSASLVRLLHNALPLERRLLPLFRSYGNQEDLLSVPWNDFRLHFPAAWLDEVCDTVYKGPRDYHPEFFELLAPRVAALQAGCIVDVGSAIGAYLLHFRACTNAPIVAYEPNPFASRLARYNLQVNDISGVEVRAAACSDVTGTALLDVGINSAIAAGSESSNAEGRTIPVSAVRLDDELPTAGRVSLIKIDCEGFEYQVLQGALSVIEEFRPALFIELHPGEIARYGHSIDELCELLRPRYSLEFWDYSRSQRSANPASRFLGRYFSSGFRFADEAAMLEAAENQSNPSQFFLLALARERSFS